MGLGAEEAAQAQAALLGEERWSLAMENTLRVLVQRYIDRYLYENALFLAERLYAQAASAENLNLLATCYMQASMPQRAYGVLTRSMDVVEAVDCDDAVTMQNRYLLAVNCMALGKLREAESALVKDTILGTQGPQRTHEEVLRGKVRVPNDAAGLHLLGLICERDNRKDHATAYYALALRLDPFLWDAYERLCRLGVDAPPESFFGRSPLQISDDGRFLAWETNPAAVVDEEDETGPMGLVDEESSDSEGENAIPSRRRRGDGRSAAAPSQRTPKQHDEAPVPVPLPCRSRPTFGAVNPDDTAAPQSFLGDLAHISSLRLPGPESAAAGSSTAGGQGSRTRSRARSRHEGAGAGGEEEGGSRVESSHVLVSTGFSLRRSSMFPWHPSPTLAEGEELQVDSAESLANLQICRDGESLLKGFENTSNRRSAGWDSGHQSASQDRGQIQSADQEQGRNQRRPVTRRSSRRAAGLGEGGVGARARGSSRASVDTENQQGAHANANVRNENSMEVTADKPAGNLLHAATHPDVAFLEAAGPEASHEIDAVIGSLFVLDLLRLMGEGYQLVNQYKCDEALAAFAKLPPAQQATGWVAHQQGRACFEMANYRRAKSYFLQMRAFAPDQTAGLEIYSTNLWHLKEEVELCYLAQQAMEIDRKSPEVWCVLGNCFSLQKEHDLAIKFFKRALMLDPTFTYASTLSGHEYVSNEDFEKATSCYRAAISNDARHYPAWYGLGTIYYRQEKYAVAEFHFRRAVAINPRSSVLYCYLGMVLHASDRCEEALEILDRASRLEPGNPQARFQRALVLRTMECFEAALIELEVVRDFAPHESSVHFLMGKLCKQLDRRDEAMVHFTSALDLDPKDANLIKLAIDKLDSDDMDEAEEL